MKLFSLTVIISILFLLQGCLGATIIASAAVVTKSAKDPRSVGRQIDDGILEARVSSAINKNKEIRCNTHIITTAYAGKILFTGQAMDLLLAEKAKQIATKIEGVQVVYNEIRKAKPINSSLSSKDVWITTKIKSKIFINNSVKLLSVKVLTEDEEVFLFGVLKKEEGDSIAKIASETDGVKRVITVFSYLD